MNTTTIAIGAAVWAVAVTVIAAVYPRRQQRRIAELERQLAKALGIIGERDDVIEVLNERNARVHGDLKRLRDRLPSLWTCPVEGHTKVDWSGNVATCMTCGKQSTDAVAEAETPVYDFGYLSLPLETQQALEKDWSKRYMGPTSEAGKDEQR